VKNPWVTIIAVIAILIIFYIGIAYNK